MQRNPLIIAYHTALLLYAGIEELSAFAISLSMMVELVIYTLIVVGFSTRTARDFSDAFMFVVISTTVIVFQGWSFYIISIFVGEDPEMLFGATIVPITIGLLGTHLLTVYKAIKEKAPVSMLRVKLGDHYMVLCGASMAGGIAIAFLQTNNSIIVMAALVIVRILVEYDFFRKPVPESEMKPGIRGFIKLTPSQQANRLLRQLRREKRRKKE